jgi:hypothetical protein
MLWTLTCSKLHEKISGCRSKHINIGAECVVSDLKKRTNEKFINPKTVEHFLEQPTQIGTNLQSRMALCYGI